MKTVHHLTQKEIEDALAVYVFDHLHQGLPTAKFKAEIIVELEQKTTGDPRDPPYSDVKTIRAEVTEQ